MNQRLFSWAWRGVLLMALLPFIALCYYTQPFHDDYANGVRVQEMGIWGAQVHLYFHWTGRFFTSFLLTAGNPLSYNSLVGIAWAVLAVFGLKLLTIALLLRTITTDKMTWTAASYVAVSVVLLYAVIVPSAYSAFYYFTDVMVYQVPALLLVVAPIAIARAQQAVVRTQRVLWLGLATVAIVGAAGSNELTIILLGWIILAAVGVSLYYQQGRSLRYWLGGLILLLAAATVAVGAPGNYYRVEIDSDPFPGLLPLILRTGDALQELLLLPNALLLLGLPLALGPLATRLLPARPPGLRLPLIIGGAVVLGGLGLGIMLYKSVWNDPVPIRAVNVLLWWWLIGWLVACWAGQPAEHASTPAPKVRAVVILVLAFVIAQMSLRAWRELLTAAPTYAQQWENRYKAFQRAGRRPGTRVVVKPLRGISARNVLLHGLDYKFDSSHPYNAQTAKWFGLAEIVRSDSQP